MSVTFPHPEHVANLWLPTLTPTTSGMISAAVGLAFLVALLTAIAALFFVGCLERAFSWRALTGTCAVLTLAIFGGGWMHLTHTHVPHDARPVLTADVARAQAQAAANPTSAWKPGARSITANGQTIQSGWTKRDLHAIAQSEATQGHMREAHQGAAAVVDTTSMTSKDIAAHGTSFVKDGKSVRCVAELGTVTRNNVGQPLTARLNQIKCADAS